MLATSFRSLAEFTFERVTFLRELHGSWESRSLRESRHRHASHGTAAPPWSEFLGNEQHLMIRLLCDRLFLRELGCVVLARTGMRELGMQVAQCFLPCNSCSHSYRSYCYLVEGHPLLRQGFQYACKSDNHWQVCTPIMTFLVSYDNVCRWPEADQNLIENCQISFLEPTIVCSHWDSAWCHFSLCLQLPIELSIAEIAVEHNCLASSAFVFTSGRCWQIDISPRNLVSINSFVGRLMSLVYTTRCTCIWQLYNGFHAI